MVSRAAFASENETMGYSGKTTFHHLVDKFKYIHGWNLNINAQYKP
jgi:hypothetical protein